MITLHEGDNRDHLGRLINQGVRVHSVICDPPYGLVSVTKRFGASGAAPAKFGTDGAFSRASAGFMGSKWDGTGIERDPEFWALVWELLLPGGYLAAFSSSRTYHRMAVAIEDAGFITHPMLGWVTGQGFPKAHNASMAIDKALGVEQGFVPEGDPVKRMVPGADQNATGDWTKTDDRHYQPGRRVPGSPEAAEWEGWAYGAQSMKPALEPIYLGQKPFSEKNGALNLLHHGVGALNIDACRVAPTGETLGGGAEQVTTSAQKGHEGWVRPWMDDEASQVDHAARVRSNVEKAQRLGRHPANLIHDGSDQVVALFPQTAPSSAAPRNNQDFKSVAKGHEKAHVTYGHADNGGSAARFFNAFPPDAPDADPIFYQGKATKADRAGSRHPTVKPVALMQWLCRLLTPKGGTILDPFAGSGTTAEAARREGFDCLLMEADPTFAADIRRRFGLAAPAIHYCGESDDILGGQVDLEDVLG